MRANTTRTTTIAELTEDERVRWAEYMKNSKDYKEPKAHPDHKDLSANWPKGFESLRDHFKKLRGTFNKIPLAYITRKKEDVPDEAIDPSTAYDSIEDELVARKGHWKLVANQPPRRTEEYKGDNKKVWDVLSDIFRNSPSWQYMKPFAKANDGRGAFLALYNFYLGPNNTNNLAAAAEAELDSLKYVGEKRRYNFEKYVNAHVSVFNVMEDLKEHGYQGIDKGTRVRRFLAGIHCRDLEHLKAQCVSNPALKEDFDGVVVVYKDYLKVIGLREPKDEDGAARIGAVEQGRPMSYPKNVNWDTSDVKVDLRHHTSEEYAKLTGPQKLKLKRWREGLPDMPQGSKTAYNPNHKIMTKHAATAAVASAGKTTAKKTGSAPKQKTNRTNKALTKQKSPPGTEGEDE
jgi:hypothetical protein